MWNIQCLVTPENIGATVIVNKGIYKKPETIPGEHSIDLLQKSSCAREITHDKERLI
jgi:hypothetical protein